MMKKKVKYIPVYKRRYFLIPFIMGLYLLDLIILYWWSSSYDSWHLKEQLKTLSPLSLKINFFLIVVALIACTKTLKDLMMEIPRKTWYMLSIIAIAGMLMCIFVPPRIHRIYYDEDIYENIGQNIAFLGKTGMCNEGENSYGEYRCYQLEYNKEPNGWPFLIGLAFSIFGVAEGVAHALNNFLYGLGILAAFLIAWLLFEDSFAGLCSALIFALIPENLMWSNTVAAEVSSSVLSSLAILAALISIKVRKLHAIFLTSTILPFSVQFRPESGLIIMVVALLFLILGREELGKEGFYLMGWIAFSLLLTHFIHIYAVKGEEWGAPGTKFSLSYIPKNIKDNSLFYIDNDRFPLIFSALMAFGLILGKKWKEKSILMIWFLLFWGIFIPFYAGSYNYGADVRFSLVSYMPLALLSGYGCSQLKEIFWKRFSLSYAERFIAIFILLGFIPFLPLIRAEGFEAWAARADHRYAKKMAKILPENSLILTHNPNMFLVWGKSAAQTSLATYNKTHLDFDLFPKFKGGIFFHYNFWCNVDDPVQNSFCDNVLNGYNCILIKAARERDYEFRLYKIEKKR